MGEGPFPTEIEGPDQARVRARRGVRDRYRARTPLRLRLDLVALPVRRPAERDHVARVDETRRSLGVPTSFRSASPTASATARRRRTSCAPERLPSCAPGVRVARRLEHAARRRLLIELPSAARRYVEFVEEQLEDRGVARRHGRRARGGARRARRRGRRAALEEDLPELGGVSSSTDQRRRSISSVSWSTRARARRTRRRSPRSAAWPSACAPVSDQSSTSSTRSPGWMAARWTPSVTASPRQLGSVTIRAFGPG